MKNPWVAAVLNFVTIGLGTVYLGRRAGVGWLAAIGGGVFLRYEEVRIAPAVTGAVTPHWVVAVTGLSLLGIAAAVDAYREAKLMGAKTR